MTSAGKEYQQYARKLARNFSGKITERVGMKRMTTFRIGGLAELMAWPETAEDVEAAVSTGLEMEIPCRILGAGSNLLVLDGGVSEVLVNMNEALQQIEIPEELAQMDDEEAASVQGTAFPVELGAGVKLANAVKQCQLSGLAGLEWAAGIPGTAGGAVIMNAGSMGTSMADVLEWVEWIVPGEKKERVDRLDLDFSYRRMARPEGAVVLGCGIRLMADDKKAIREKIVKGLKWRRHNQPLSYPSAGSVFKNPEDDYAGRLIEEVGLKGERRGDAQISDLHANFIVNRGRARSRDVTLLMELAREAVSKEFGIDLELEIEIIGEEIA